jgi:hypothetical protein
MSQLEDFNLAKALREKLRTVEDRLARNANMSPLTRADEQEMATMQARVDAVYVKAGRRAPPPLPYERPREFRRRLAAGLQEYSPQFHGADLATMADDALNVVEPQLFADAAAYAPTHGIKPDEIRAFEKVGAGGHREIEYSGGPRAHFTKNFAPPIRFARLKSQHYYESMARDSMLARVEQVMRRPPLTSPRAGF